MLCENFLKTICFAWYHDEHTGGSKWWRYGEWRKTTQGHQTKKIGVKKFPVLNLCLTHTSIQLYTSMTCGCYLIIVQHLLCFLNLCKTLLFLEVFGSRRSESQGGSGLKLGTPDCCSWFTCWFEDHSLNILRINHLDSTKWVTMPVTPII